MLTLAIILPALFSSSSAQTTLTQGDISLIGWNSNSNRGVAFVTWVDLSTGTEIRFTDNGFNLDGTIRWQETLIIWTANGLVPAGSVVTIENEVTNTGTANVINSTGLDPSITAIAFSNTGGDQVFAYQGANMPTTTTATTGNSMTFNNTLLFGLGYRGNSLNTTWLSTGTVAGTASSFLPSSLVSPNRIYHGGSGVTGGQYSGARTGYTTAAGYRALIEDPANWTNATGLSATVTYTTTSFSLSNPVSITGQPSASSICAGANTSFSITASNAASYQWHVNTGGGFTALSNTGVYSGVGTATLSITGATAGMNGYTYRCVATGADASTATSNIATLTVNSAPAITQNPFPSSVCEGDGVLFYIAASNTTGYQWQVNTGSGYSNLSNGAGGTGGVYSGVTSSVLIINSPTLAMSGYTYRCIASGACSPSATSTGAVLTISANVTYYEDYDSDGYGNSAVTTTSCTGAPTGFVANSDDCDDNDANAIPGMSIWTGAVNTLWSNPANWSCGALPVDTSNVIINSVVNMPVVDITTAVCNNLTIGTGSSLTINSGMVLSIKGSVTNNGSFAAAGKTTFSGGNQSIPGGAYTDLEITGTGTKTLSGAATLSGTLILTATNLVLGNNDLTIAGTGGITGGSAAHYIVVNGSGRLKQQNIGMGGRTGAIVFPIGTATSYTPLSLTNTGTADEFGAGVIDQVYDTYDANDVPTGSAQTTDNVNKTWLVTEAVPGGSTVTLSFQWNGSDELPAFDRATAKPAHFKNGNWTAPAPTGASGSNPYFISMTGITSFSPFGVGSTNSVLPLTLLSFTGKESAEGIALQWSTAQEVNTAAFDIERASAGGNFSMVGSVPAGTNGTYNYIDRTASEGTTYSYRLKMRDNDGRFTYSSTIVLKLQSKSTIGFAVYPNPVTGTHIYVKPNITNNINIKIDVIDMNGKVWSTHGFTNNNISNNRFEVPVKQLPTGSYILRITDKNGERLQVSKFTVNH